MRRELDAIKTTIRCFDLDLSRRFHTATLGLTLVEEWDQPEGRGCILHHAGRDGRYLELSREPPRTDLDVKGSPTAPTGELVELQWKTPCLDAWVRHLSGRCEVEGPVDRPWGNRYRWLRDPDGLRIAIFEGRS